MRGKGMIYSLFSRRPAGAGNYLFSNADLAKLFVPLMVEQFLGFMVGLADSVMVAHVGESAVSGVSLVDFLMVFLISIFAALSSGGVVIAGQYMGKTDMHKAREAADQLVWFVGLTATGVMILVLILKPLILGGIFGQISADVRFHADTYLTYVSLSIPAIGLYSAGAAIFRTTGNAVLPMRVALLAGLMNIVGNALALYVFDLGTAGVAISTLLSRCTGAAIILWLGLTSRHALRLRRTLHHRFKWPVIKQMLRIGIPYGLENGLFNFGRIVVLGLVATFGTASIAANAVAGNVTTFAVLPGVAIGLGLTAVVARCVGAGDFEQARYYTKKVIGIVYAVHLVAALVVVALIPFVIRVYGLSAESAALTVQLLLWNAVLSVLLWPLSYTLPVTFRAAGDVKYTMYVGVLSMGICRISLAYILGGWLGLGVFGTWLAMFMDWIIRIGFFVWRYCNNRWTLHRAV